MTTPEQREKWRKIGRGSARKGRRAEGEVVRIITDWWKVLEPDAKFVRTPKSGGWSVSKVRGEFRASGDIMTTSDLWPFCVEVKRREGWKIGTFAGGAGSPVWGWWREAIHAAVEVHTQPMLVFRRSKQPWWILLPRDYAQRNVELEPDIFWPGVPRDYRGNVPDFGGVVPSAFIATRFFDNVHPRTLKKEAFP